jgi:PQQ-dependent dehydrogenase (methanol/ethanol family)
MGSRNYQSFITPLAVAILAMTWIASAELQNRRINANDLKNAGKTGEEWLSYGRDLAETRYSPLKQIDTSNVNRLGLAWTYEIGRGRGIQEGTLLMADGVVYGITNLSVTFALDARTGKQIWRYDPEVDQPTIVARNCCGIVNRGIAIYDGKIFVPVIDGRLVALDASTGAKIWSTQTTPTDQPYTMTMAPRIAKNKVIVGNAGADKPVRGFFSAYDTATGKLVWRFYTVPGDPSKGFENNKAAMEMASKTWSGEWWKMGGGGTVWDSITYDPDTNLVMVGTGNGGPYPIELRQSKGLDNLFVASVVAVDADSGQYKWHYQFVPGDSWDFDSVQQLTVANLAINGRNRKVVMQANKNGFFYVIDRTDGKLISAAPFAQVNWASGVDLKTGRPLIYPEAFYGRTQTIRIMPGGTGAHNWAPMSFNPNTGLMYIPSSASTSDQYAIAQDFVYKPGDGNNEGVAPRNRGGGGTAAGLPPPGPPLPVIGPQYTGDWLIAWDVVMQKERWRVQGANTTSGGTVTTAGNLVFQSYGNGRLRALSADKGEQLIDIPTGQPRGMSPPITFMVDNKQYVAVAGGVVTAAAGAVRREGGPPPPPNPHVYVYALADNAQNPTPVRTATPAAPPAGARGQ